jgi:hypothetical protein
MPESIVVVRLTRNLRYKLTYVKIFESYLDSTREPELVALLKALIQAQQAAIGPLSRYLRHLDASTQDLELDDKLLAHAAERDNSQAKLRFIYDGLKRAVAWYRTQLMDRQMTRDPELSNGSRGWWKMLDARRGKANGLPRCPGSRGSPPRNRINR